MPTVLELTTTQFGRSSAAGLYAQELVARPEPGPSERDLLGRTELGHQLVVLCLHAGLSFIPIYGQTLALAIGALLKCSVQVTTSCACTFEPVRQRADTHPWCFCPSSHPCFTARV